MGDIKALSQNVKNLTEQAYEQGIIDNRDRKMLTNSKYVSDLDVKCVEKVLASTVHGQISQGDSYQPSQLTVSIMETIMEKTGMDLEQGLAEVRKLSEAGMPTGDNKVDLAKKLADSVFDLYEAQNPHQLAAARGTDMLEASVFRWLRKK